MDWFTPLVYVLSYLFSLLLLLMSLRYGEVTQPSQFYFYVLGFVCNAVIVRSANMRRKDPERYDQFDGDRDTDYDK